MKKAAGSMVPPPFSFSQAYSAASSRWIAGLPSSGSTSSPTR
jgi:hypothetical protein